MNFVKMRGTYNFGTLATFEFIYFSISVLQCKCQIVTLALKLFSQYIYQVRPWYNLLQG